jgi:hypothetical protein
MSSVVAIIVLKEREIVARFRREKAVTAESARPLATVRVDDNIAVRSLRKRNILRDAGAGRLYLDEAAWDAFVASRRRWAMTVLGTVVVIAALAAAVLWPR